MMIDVESYRQNAADCLRQAEGEDAPEDKNILLNVALAWVRLAKQVQETQDEATQDDAQNSDTPPLAADAPGDHSKADEADETNDASPIQKLFTTH
jgi:hypothetical protein